MRGNLSMSKDLLDIATGFEPGIGNTVVLCVM